MSESGIENLTVAGCGVLGGQIAWHSAFKGKSVTVLDLDEAGLQACRIAHDTYAYIYQQELSASDEAIQATRDRLNFTTDLAEAVCDADLVIEAVPEVPEIKTEFFRQIATLLPEKTLVVTNSSTLLPSMFAKVTGRPEKFCSLHFANMIWKGNLGEVMAHEATERQTILRVTQFAIEIGMVPVPMQKESSGYVINALLVPIMHAAQTLITNGISTPETIDKTYMIMNVGCKVGPCGLMDIVGMKTCYDICVYWGEVNKDEQMLANAAYIKKHFLDKGLQGLQGGQGYYSYPNPDYSAESFLDVPDISMAEEIASLVKA